jgi:hypothetical protein
MATVLIFLSDVQEGGETVFPKVPPPPSQTRAAGFSECAMKGLAAKPKKGSAVLFWRWAGRPSRCPWPGSPAAAPRPASTCSSARAAPTALAHR